MGDNCENMPPRKRQKVQQEVYYDNNILDIKPTVTGNNEAGPANDTSLGPEQSNQSFLGNDISHEEIEKLKEFQVLDEVNCNEGSEDEQSDSSDGMYFIAYGLEQVMDPGIALGFFKNVS